MVEVEVKLPIVDLKQTEEDLTKLGFEPAGQIREEDTYYDNEEGTIRTEGEALRVRRITDLETGETTAVTTFKGKKLDEVSMTRPELETGVENADKMDQIYRGLGYQPADIQVIKERKELKRDNMNACLDQVTGLCSFLELEVVIPDEGDVDTALAQIEETLQQLGHNMNQTVTTSYLGLLQMIAGKTGR